MPRRGEYARAIAERQWKPVVWEWFVSQPLEKRVRILTVEDRHFVQLVMYMFETKREDGQGLFYESGLEEMSLATDVSDDFCFVTLKALSFNGSRRQHNCVYPEHLLAKDLEFEEMIRLCDTKEFLDTLNIATMMVMHPRRFLRLMEHASRGSFLSLPCKVRWEAHRRKWAWQQPKWFVGMGYYSLATFVAQRIEVGMWQHFFEDTGLDPRQPGTKRTYIYPSSNVHALLSKLHLTQFWRGLTPQERLRIVGSVGSMVDDVLCSLNSTNQANATEIICSRKSHSGTSSRRAFRDGRRSGGVACNEFGRPRKANESTWKWMRTGSDVVAWPYKDHIRMLSALLDFSTHKPLQAIVMHTHSESPSSGAAGPLASNLALGDCDLLELLYFSPLKTAGSVSLILLRRLGFLIQNAYSERLAMDLILSDKPKSKKTRRKAQPAKPSKKKGGRGAKAGKAKKKAKKKSGAQRSGSSLKNELSASSADAEPGGEVSAAVGASAAVEEEAAIEADEDEECHHIAVCAGQLSKSCPSVAEDMGLLCTWERIDALLSRPRSTSDCSASAAPDDEDSGHRQRSVSDAEVDGEWIVSAGSRKRSRSGRTTPTRQTKKPQSGKTGRRRASASFDAESQTEKLPRRSLSASARSGRVRSKSSPGVKRTRSAREGTKSHSAKSLSSSPVKMSPRSHLVGSSICTSPTRARGRLSYASAVTGGSEARAAELVSMATEKPTRPIGSKRPPLIRRKSAEFMDATVSRSHPMDDRPLQLRRLVPNVPRYSYLPFASAPTHSDADEIACESSSGGKVDDRGTEVAAITSSLLEGVPRATIDLLQGEVQACVESMEGRVEARHHRLALKMVRRLWCVVGALWPAARIDVYGSFSTGLCIPSSDLDLLVVIPMQFCSGPSPIHLLATELSKQPWVKALQPLFSAKVPVLKLESWVEQLPTDITFDYQRPRKNHSGWVERCSTTHRWADSNYAQLSHLNLDHSSRVVPHSGMQTCKFVNDLKASLPSLKPMVLMIKQYLHERGLNEAYTGGLSSYSLVLMVGTFLKRYRLSPLFVGAEGDSHLGALLLGFFELYGLWFDYEKMGISVLNEGSLFLKSNWPIKYGQTALLIVDPMRPDNNIGSGTFNIHKVKAAFQSAFRTLVTPFESGYSSNLLGRIIEAARPPRRMDGTATAPKADARCEVRTGIPMPGVQLEAFCEGPSSPSDSSSSTSDDVFFDSHDFPAAASDPYAQLRPYSSAPSLL